MHLGFFPVRVTRWLALLSLLFGPSAAAQGDLILDGTTRSLSGIHRYGTVRLTNGAKIVVSPYNGQNKQNTGNLEIRANSITIDASSSIVADGAGYQAVLCDDGPGPSDLAGGRGGCAVLDSGGGGAHFGAGGRGTKDCFCVSPSGSCQFPAEFEEACGYRDPMASHKCRSLSEAPVGTCPTPFGSCYNNDGLPSVAGEHYWHSIYQSEFGSAGGDKGCRDGWDGCSVGGNGGGRIVLAAVNAQRGGTLTIAGTVTANGTRGCGSGNDSGGGGAGGSVLLVGDQVSIAGTARVQAAGGLGGDTNAKQPGAGCASCAQDPGGTCDDCGGGGGGGIISVLAGQPASISATAAFDVRGALGGTCPICRGEAGGSAGELQLDGVYVGEFCDGFDNDFDGEVDEGLGDVSCGSGACQVTVQQCNTSDPQNVFPNDCVPGSASSCQPPLVDTRSRFLVIADSSGSMLTDLSGAYTFGDGSHGHEGLDTDGDGKTNDSRLYKLKNALTNVIAAYPEIDFGLARFAQGVKEHVNCQLAHWFECQGLCCSYDNPKNNSGGTPPEGTCAVRAGAAGSLVVQPVSPGEECINYAGSCGQPRRGADVLVGFEKPVTQKLRWLDHQETNFIADTTEGNHCNYTGGGDCELRGTGPTPLAGALNTAQAFLAAATASDPIASCRKYAVILLTDGAETCNGNPQQAAVELLSLGIETYVIGFSVLSGERQQLNDIAKAGSPGGTRTAFFADDEDQLAAALAAVVAGSVIFEKCNERDDDCDLLVDEDFPLKGAACDNGLLGLCHKTGNYVCSADGSGVVCNAPAASGGEEICNGLDDDCDGSVDEGLSCCVPQPEICNNKDDNCNDEIDEGIPSQDCGKAVGECRPGKTACENGQLTCSGGAGPTDEVCDGRDNDCDGRRDGMSEPCYDKPQGCTYNDATRTWDCLGLCKPGFKTCSAVQNGSEWSGTWGPCAGQVGPAAGEICNGLDDDCDGTTDNDAECPTGSRCQGGQCTLPCSHTEFGCPPGQLCKDDWCVPDPCDATACHAKGWICLKGECVDACANVTCRKYEKCVFGVCEDTSCYSSAHPCPSGQSCIEGVCQAGPCDPHTVRCGADEFCREGRCLKLCDALSCADDEICKVIEQGGTPVSRCIKDPCARLQCDVGYSCVDGACVEDPCLKVYCPAGEVCSAGTCIKDPCELVRCPRGFVCSQGSCLPSAELLTTTELLASGGGGCQMGGGAAERPGTGALLGLLAAGLFSLRRQARARRRAGR